MSRFGALIEFLYITPFIILFPDLFNINVSVLCSNTAKVLLYNGFVMFPKRFTLYSSSICAKDFDGDKIINNIENKIKNNQKITRHEMLNLALAPFMSSKKPLDKQIEKTVKTLDEVRKSMKCSSDFVFGIELLIVEKFIKNERQHKKLTNILRDTMKIIDEWRQEDYENGKKEGKEEEKINTAKNMLKENYTIKQIATITQLNIESIKQIKAEFGK